MKKYLKMYFKNLYNALKLIIKHIPQFLLIIFLLLPAITPLILIERIAYKNKELISLKCMMLWLLWCLVYGFLIVSALNTYEEWKSIKENNKRKNNSSKGKDLANDKNRELKKRKNRYRKIKQKK